MSLIFPPNNFNRSSSSSSKKHSGRHSRVKKDVNYAKVSNFVDKSGSDFPTECSTSVSNCDFCLSHTGIGTYCPSPALRTSSSFPVLDTSDPSPALRTCGSSPALRTSGPSPALRNSGPSPVFESSNLEDYPHVCPLRLNNQPPNTCLTASVTPYIHTCPTSPEGLYFRWSSSWGPERCSTSYLSRYKTPTFASSSNQWDESLNFNMSSKDYQRVGSSMPCIGRVLLVVLLMATLPLTSAMSPPPNYSRANMPTTNFTCADKATGGYYADPEAECQMFHVCVRISDDEMNDFRFLCPNDTVFDQQNFICTNWWEIDCERSTRYYSKNDLFRVAGEQPAEYEYENENQDSPVYYEYVYEYVDPDGTTKEQPQGGQGSQASQGVDAVGGVHRLNLGKSQNGNLKGRSVETSFQQGTTGSTTPQSTTTQVRRTTTTSTSTTTTTRPPTKVTTPLPVTTPVHTTIRLPHFNTSRSVSSRRTASISRVQHPKVSSPSPSTEATTPHRLAFKSVSAFVRPTTSRPTSAPLHEHEKIPVNDEKQNEEKEDLTNKQLNLNSEDPFANYDWKKDSAVVTAANAARTRYEALFGATSSRGRNFVPKRMREPVKHPPHPPQTKTTTTTTSTTTSPQPVVQNERTNNRKIPESQIQRARNGQALSEAKHKEFSNFRFYKTAFGRSYSSDDLLGETGTNATPIRVSDPVRLERTASRNTRYSIYG